MASSESHRVKEAGRRAGDALLGIFMQDRREQGRTIVYLAERGQTVEANG